ncbi:MAG: glycosyltransferase [Elusimicrobia bacterium]|nr:glycosyltransferase [Elusimicrobiota bacterium]
MNVSIVIPAKNEAATIGTLLEALQQVTKNIKQHEFEIIVVDDHSNDKTVEIAKNYGIKIITNQRRSGKGNALRTGFEISKGEIILMLDADGSHKANEIPSFLKPFEDSEVGLVVGSRATGGSEEYTTIRTIGNVGLSFLTRIAFGIELTDVLNGYKAFKKEVFTDFHYTSEEFEIEIELVGKTLRHGYKIAEFPSHELHRAGGEAKSRVVRHGFRFLWRIIAEGFFVRFATHKHKIFSIHCKLCHYPHMNFLFKKNGYNIVDCPRCELAFVAEMPTEHDLSGHYDENYFEGDVSKFGYADYEKEKKCRMITYAAKKRKIEQLVSSGSLLDVGCADGSFLELFDSSWKSEGVEISESMVQQISEKKRKNIFCGDLMKLNGKERVYDVITMWDLIDHVPLPLQVIEKASALLKPGGFLFLNVGDRNSLFAKLNRKRWYIFIPPTHLYYYNKKSIIKLLVEGGFKIIKISYPGKYVTLGLCFWRLRYIIPCSLINLLSKWVNKSFLSDIKIYINFFDIMTVTAIKPK